MSAEKIFIKDLKISRVKKLNAIITRFCIKSNKKNAFLKEINSGYKAVSLSLTSTASVSLRSNTFVEDSFEVGVINRLSDSLKKYMAPCVLGYHYCMYLTDVLAKFRPYQGKKLKNNTIATFKYCIIDVLEPSIQNGREYVTSAFRIKRILNREDIIHILAEERKYFKENMQSDSENEYKERYESADSLLKYIRSEHDM